MAARSTILRAVLIGLLIAPQTGAIARAADLVSPFDVAARRELRGAPLDAFTCPAVPRAVRDLRFDGYYADRGAGSSVIDQRAHKLYRDATESIGQFENGITRITDRYVASKPADPRPAVCALDWLAVWARAGAMLGEVTQQGGFVRKWGLAPVSASYLKIRDEPSLDGAKKAEIEKWIARWARVVRDDYDSARLESRRNNHLYWAAWSVGLAAVVLDDRSMLDWSLAKARLGLAQVRADGTLPLEMARKARAYHYHVFATAPLIMTAEIAARNGGDLYGDADGALGRLVSRVLSGFDDDSFFARTSGQPQDRSGSSKGSHVAWLEAYYARRGDDRAASLIAKLRPMRERRLGGDMTLLFGVELR